MLDVSIKQLTAKYKKPEQLLEFMTLPCTVEHKTDGVKLTLIKIADTGTLDDWLVSYKGSIFYRGEFDYQDTIGKKLSLGNSQFDMVFDHLESLGKTNIDINTEFFIEFLVKKQTVMSDYATTGKMILIGYGEANPELRFGKVTTNSKDLKVREREKYARELRINLPPLLFEGTWYPSSELLKGCVDTNLRKAVIDNMSLLRDNQDDPVGYYNLVSNIFLSIESQFGGKEEGIVIKNEDGIFKVQQNYQLDKDSRYAKKRQYMEDDEELENLYWKQVQSEAHIIADKIQTQDIPTGLKQIAQQIKALDVADWHSKKNEQTIKDDIQVNAKTFFLKKLRGNDGALIIGKFRVLTTGHQRMIDRAIRESNDVVIGLVSSKNNKDTAPLRLRMLRLTYPNLRIIELSTGNLFTAFKKAGININKIYAGSDRVLDYERQLMKAPGVEVNEIERTSVDISATKVIENIENFTFFKRNTPKAIHFLYPEILEVYR